MKQALFMAVILVAPLPCFADIAEAAVDFHEGRFETALTTLEPLARAGNPSAEYLLGRMYFGGSGVAKDRTKALEYFDAAAKRGNAAAQCALGTIYYGGEGVPKDAGKAASWFQKAVDQDFAPARPLLAWLYENGEGVPRDEARAKLLRGPDGWGYPRLISECGWEEPKNSAAISARRFEEAIGRGDPEAEFHRGERFYGDEKYQDAVSWFLKAADHGQVDAQFALATMYLDAKGVARDPAKAMQWLEKASEQWDMIAMAMLCKMNMERDPARAYMYGYLVEIARKADAPLPSGDFVDRMTPAQIAEGRAATAEFLTKHPRPEDAASRNRYSYH